MIRFALLVRSRMISIGDALFAGMISMSEPVAISGRARTPIPRRFQTRRRLSL